MVLVLVCACLNGCAGDGTGPDIWRASVRVMDAAVKKAYGGKKKIEWLEVLAGEKAFKTTGGTDVTNCSSLVQGCTVVLGCVVTTLTCGFSLVVGL